MRIRVMLALGAVVLLVACAVNPATPPSEPSSASTPAPASVASPPGSAAPNPTATPSASSMQSDEPNTVASSNRPIARLQVPFFDKVMDLAIVGEPGLLAAWRPATQRELEAFPWAPDGFTGLGGLGDRQLVLGWLGTPCDLVATLIVTETSLVIDPAPRHGCDAIGVPRGLVLTYARAVDPKAIDVRLLPRELLPEPS